MSTPLPLHRPLTALAAATLIFVGLCSPSRAIDDNATKQIWKLKYGVSDTQLADNVWLNQDTDGDGLKNGDEIGAGTNPFLGSSTVKVSSFVKNGANVELQFPTQSGKRYRVESTATLVGGAWTLQPQPTPVEVIGDGTTKMLSVAYVANNFYRVRVDDVDTDGEGVGNWAELAVTLDPGDTETVNGTNDLAYVNAQIALPNKVTITATAPFATEDGPSPGKLTVTRTQNLFPILVALNVTGTAGIGTDYTALPSSVPFAARGATTVDLNVNPIVPQAAVNGSKSVTAAIAPPGVVEFPFAVGAPGSATVIIKDSTAPTGTGLRARYYDTASTTYANAANFNAAQLKIDRVDPLVDNDWGYGTPNGVALSAPNSPDNYSDSFETYLSPTTAGNYQFQLDADDKARVLLDLNGNGVFDLPGEQIVEHGWDTAASGSPVDGIADDETVGTFKISTAYALAVPANPGLRYRMRVEHAETTGDARCRLQWRAGTAAFANIPQGNQFTHTQTMSGYTVASAVLTVNTDAAHGLSPSDPVRLWFNSGLLFSTGSYNSSDTVSYTVLAVVDADTFTVSIPGAPNTSGDGFVGNATSTTTGVLNQCYANTTLTNPPGRVGVDAAVTTGNNGIWGSGTPDVALIVPDTFSIRWTGQVQPQFTEEYTIAVHADDGVVLKINGQDQDLRQTLSANVGGATYSYDDVTGDTVVTYSAASIAASSIAVGDVVRLDPSSGTLTSLGTLDYTVTAATSTTFTVNFGTGTFATGTGNMNIDMLNRVIKPWASNSNERYVRIPMVGGTRYDIQLDYYENTVSSRARLYWFSPSQPKEIIPTNRLYPSTGVVQAPTAHLTQTDATALVNGPFSLAVLGSNLGTVTFGGTLPGWLSYGGGLLTGTPGSGDAGDYQIIVTITNAAGTSTSVINLHVEETDGDIIRERWDSVAGVEVASIPTGLNPTGTNVLTSLEAATNTADNYGARLRGYITAPETGNYYFWIASSNASELWISNDDEPVNAFKRAWVSSTGTASQQWNLESNQKSPWLALEQGKKYYIEVLHKAGVGADNLAVGWSKPGQSASAPSEVVPGYTLSNYVAPAPGSTPGTLFVATMLAQSGADTDGVGSSTLRLSEDETVAYFKVTYSGLSPYPDDNPPTSEGPFPAPDGTLAPDGKNDPTDWHIHSDPYLTHASSIIYDGVEPPPGDGLQPDGSHKWTITAVGTLSANDIRELLKQGKAYINLHSAAYPNGEIRGNYTLANGSRTFTPPPSPPSYTDDHATDNGAARFLTQATFGPNADDIVDLKTNFASYEAWIDDQFTKAASPHLPEVIRTEFANAQGGAFDETLSFNAWWWRSITADDQLRQRIAFALSEIHVISGAGPLDNNARAISYFYDKLATNAFGNFRDILQDTTLTPTMGRYLDMLRNDKPDYSVGRIPNENYAREIKQLFSVGLYRMWPDGSLMLTSKDSPVDVYGQREIVGFAHVFTGWDYGYDGAFRTSFSATTDWTRQMREVPARHFTGPKRILNNEVLPGITTVGSQPLDPDSVTNSMVFNDAAYQNLPAQELDAAHDQLFNHPNVGPFICRQLIQRLVTSHPSRDYLYRVVQKFNDNGSGVRGDMKAVIKAILLDYEARSTDLLAIPAYGKQREPVMRVAAAGRAFRRPGWSGTYDQNGSTTITITVPAGHGLNDIGTNPDANEFLDFTSGSPPPHIGSYGVTYVNATTLTTTAAGWATGTYNIPTNSTICTVTMSNHWLQVGHQVFVDFTSGGANSQVGVDGQVYTLASATAETGAGNFTFPVTAQVGARSGNCMIPRFSPGSYVVSNLSAADQLLYPGFTDRVTLDTNTTHNLSVGDQVQLNFFGGNPQPPDFVGVVHEVVDLNTYTVLGVNLDPESFNSVYQFPLLSQPLVRSGNVSSRASTFAMNNTDLVLDQTPLNSPTVFNFYLPEYKFPGTLAAQGITTPEFQETAETSVIRQSNFLYDGLFNPTLQNSLSSFITGNNALVLNFSPWMPNAATNLGLGAAPTPTRPWTHNQNIDTLITRLSTLLLAGQLSAEAKEKIRDFVSMKISSISAGAGDCTVTTLRPHNLVTGNVVCISGVGGGTYSGVATTLNSTTATLTITKTGDTTFTVNGLTCSASPTAGNLTNAHVSEVVYNQGDTTPDEAHKRDRLRAIVHLILTSPDFTIQR